jgi:hypothetical protein
LSKNNLAGSSENPIQTSKQVMDQAKEHFHAGEPHRRIQLTSGWMVPCTQIETQAISSPRQAVFRVKDQPAPQKTFTPPQKVNYRLQKASRPR